MRGDDSVEAARDQPFPTTMWSDVLEAGDPGSPRRRERLGQLLEAYWKPVYAYVRVGWRASPDDARDLTQAFFARLLEKDTFARIERDRGSFRGYLKTALKHFLLNARDAESARRGHRPVVRLDAAPGELDRLGLAAPGDSPEAAYDREWFRTVFGESIRELETSMGAAGKEAWFEAFRLYCLEPAGEGAPGASSIAFPGGGDGKRTYREVAERLGAKESDVRNWLASARRELRRLVRRRIRGYVATDEDVERELLDAARA